MSYHRKQEEKRRLNKLYNETRNSYGAGAYYDYEKNRIIKYSCHRKQEKLHCRRMIRRRLKNQTGCYSGCIYKRFYDYWWSIL